MTDMVQISLKSARVNANMSRDAVAKHMNVTSQTITNWEKGVSSPTINQAKELSSLYKMPLDNIIF